MNNHEVSLLSSSSNSVAALLSRALQHHQAGQLDQAELLYRHVLDEEPEQPDALHLLGVVAHQRGRPDRAAALIRRALSARPDDPGFHANLSEACRAAGDPHAARQHAEAAVRLQPNAANFRNSLGLALQTLGLHEEAAAQFEQAIRLDPDLPLPHNNLALSLRELGRHDEAIAALRRAVCLAPAFAEARSNLGQMLLEHHQTEEALAHCREAVRLRTDYPEGLNNLGNVFRELGRLEEARDCYQQVLRVQPGQAMAYNNLGQAMQEEGRLDEAVALYQKALALAPNTARFLCNLASALHEQDRDADALALCRRALQRDPRYPEAHALLGTLREEGGDLDGAAASYREALRLRPWEGGVLVSLGHLLAERGELEAAEASCRQALQLEPRNPGAHASLATSLGRKLPEDDLQAALRVLAEAPMSQRQRSALRYGLAHALDGRGRHAEAAELLRLANADRLQLLRRQGKGYDPALHDRFIDQLLQAFSPGYFARVRGWGLDSELPVFIVGLPRSGTTLTEQVLASHPQVHGAGELRLAREAFESMPALLGLQGTPLASVGRYSREAVASAAGRHLERLHALGGPAVRVVDKMPDNYLYLGLLATLFPRARFIHTRRDVRDTALSCWMTDFKQIHWACDLGHIAGRVRAYERVMAHWRQVLPLPLLEVDYEETVADLEGVARRLVAWCGLEWDPACLKFHEGKRPVRTASLTQVREPVHGRSVGRWKNYAEALTPLLEQLPAVHQ